MRIVGGLHRSRKLLTPQGDGIRPTSDKVRQAVFNMLNSRGLVQEAVVLDAFCGTGALGLEALSQGASFCTFFDKNKNSIRLCRENIAVLKEGERSKVFLTDSLKPQENEESANKANLVFMDPPYSRQLIPKTVKALHDYNWLQEECFFVLEEDRSESIESNLLEIINQKIYGDTQICLAVLKS